MMSQTHIRDDSCCRRGSFVDVDAHPRDRRHSVKARNVVLVHGLFADGSCWLEVIPRLQAAGLNVTRGAESADHAARGGGIRRALFSATAGRPDGAGRSFLPPA